MQQNASYIPGDTDSSEIRQVLKTATVTLQMCIMSKNSGSDVEFTCLSQGGMIKQLCRKTCTLIQLIPNQELGMGDSRNAKKTGLGKIFNQEHMVTGYPFGFSTPEMFKKKSVIRLKEKSK